MGNSNAKTNNHQSKVYEPRGLSVVESMLKENRNTFMEKGSHDPLMESETSNSENIRDHHDPNKIFFE